MKREDIEKAAAQISFIETPDARERFLLRSGFKAGAKWRIDSVWHNSLKDAKPEKQVLVKFTNKLITTFDDVRYLKGIEDMVEEFAYIEDLIQQINEKETYENRQ